MVGDGDLLSREGVAQILEAVPGFEVVAVVGDARALREAVERSRPDIVVADTRVLPARGREGLEIAEMLDARYPGVGLLVLGVERDPGPALALFRRGVTGRGYLLKHHVAGAGEFAHAVCSIARGGTLVDPLVIEDVAAAQTRAERSPLRTLTPREQATLKHLARGKNNGAIARDLGVTRRAVEHQVQSIFTKLALHDDADTIPRVHATLLCLAWQEPHDQPDADHESAVTGELASGGRRRGDVGHLARRAEAILRETPVAAENSAFHRWSEEAQASGTGRHWGPTVDPDHLADVLWNMHNITGETEAKYPE